MVCFNLRKIVVTFSPGMDGVGRDVLPKRRHVDYKCQVGLDTEKVLATCKVASKGPPTTIYFSKIYQRLSNPYQKIVHERQTVFEFGERVKTAFLGQKGRHDINEKRKVVPSNRLQTLVTINSFSFFNLLLQRPRNYVKNVFLVSNTS